MFIETKAYLTLFLLTIWFSRKKSTDKLQFDRQKVEYDKKIILQEIDF